MTILYTPTTYIQKRIHYTNEYLRIEYEKIENKMKESGEMDKKIKIRKMK